MQTSRVHPGFPGASYLIDKAGVVRWRFRRKGKVIYLPGKPGDEAFETAYLAAIAGQRVPTRRNATILRYPGTAPKSFGDAYQRLKKSPRWRQLDDKTRANQGPLIERFLTTPVAEGEVEIWRDMPVADMRRRHLLELIEAVAETTPHSAKSMLVAVRKLISTAMREEWVDSDCSVRLDWTPPPSTGSRPWTAEAMAAFEKRHAVGSRARTAYALARWMGNRRSDCVLLEWSMLETRRMLINGRRREVTGFNFVQFKGRHVKPVRVFLPMTPMLNEALAPLDRTKEYVLTASHGGPYSIASLSVMMRVWTAEAGLAGGWTLHGLRKTLGGDLDDAEATGGQGQDVLGHSNSRVHDDYRKSRNRARNSVLGMERVVKLVKSGG